MTHTRHFAQCPQSPTPTQCWELGSIRSTWSSGDPGSSPAEQPGADCAKGKGQRARAPPQSRRGPQSEPSRLAQTPNSELQRQRQNGDTYFRPGVHDVDEVASWIGFPDGLQHLLVFQAPGAEAGQGLAAPADGGLRGGAGATQQRQTAVQPDPADRQAGRTTGGPLVPGGLLGGQAVQAVSVREIGIFGSAPHQDV